MKKIKIVLIAAMLVMGLSSAVGAEEKKPLCEVQYDDNGIGIDTKFMEDVCSCLETAAGDKNIHRIRKNTNLAGFVASAEMRGEEFFYATESPDYLIIASFSEGNSEGEYNLYCTLNKNNQNREIVSKAASVTIGLKKSKNELQEICNNIMNVLYKTPNAGGMSLYLFRIDSEACLEWTAAKDGDELEYKAVYSKDRDEVTDVERAKKLALKSSVPWKSEKEDRRQNFDSNDLKPDMDYYFTVVVRNKLGCYAVSPIRGSAKLNVTMRMGGTLTLIPPERVPGEKHELDIESNIEKPKIEKSFMLSDGTWQINMHYDMEEVKDDSEKISIDSSETSEPVEIKFETVSDSFLARRLDFGKKATNSSTRETAFKDAANAENKEIAGAAMYELGCLYEKDEDYDEAIRWYKSGEEKKDDASKTALIKLYYNLGRFFEENEEYFAAMEWYEKGKEKKDDDSKKALAELYYKLGRKSEEEKNIKDAIGYYDRGIQEKHGLSKLARAKIYEKDLEKYKKSNKDQQFEMAELENALKDCNAALELLDDFLKESNVDVFNNLSTIKQDIEKRKEVLDKAEKARQKNQKWQESMYDVFKTKRNRSAWYIGANVRYSPIYRSFPVSSEFENLPWVWSVTLGSTYGFFPWMFAGLECDFGSWWKPHSGRPTFTLAPMISVGLNTDFFGNDWLNYYLVFGGGVFIPWNETAVGTPHPKFRAGIGVDFYPGGKNNTGDFFFNIEYTADYTMGMGFEDRIKIGIGWYLDKPGSWRQGIVPSYRGAKKAQTVEQ